MMNRKEKLDGANIGNMGRKISITVIRDWLGFLFSVAGFWISLLGTVHSDIQMSQREVLEVNKFYISIFEIDGKSLYKQVLIPKNYSDNEDFMQQKKIEVSELLIIRESDNCRYIAFIWKISLKQFIQMELNGEPGSGFYLPLFNYAVNIVLDLTQMW